ncbi:hypothetical protein [Aquipseudomonas alcaligenes]|uniref:ATPase AAA-type core domain-containing protein n=1 Tax=Aquipseudomonas alcaligenes TaxID=43263 RepID=A0AA42STS6_AQUAC|nr:hypothetical protein [Pseudomonas alcaligenes]MDH1055276.1 hypothetical protein [Pseudomonas alcaligenes]
MQTTTLTLIVAALVLALIGLAVFSRRSAESARATGYNLGYDDAESSNADLAQYQAAEILRLQNQLATNRAEQSQQVDAIMQDCDARIAIYAARALSAEDITTLQVANKQLALAAETYNNFKLHDQTRFAATVHGRLEQLITRLKEAHGSSNPLELAEQAMPNGKSWLVYGPEGCGKTRNARAIANALGLTDILDDWQPGMQAPTTKTLVLTNSTGPFEPFCRRLLSFEQAMSLPAVKAQLEVAA